MPVRIHMAILSRFEHARRALVLIRTMYTHVERQLPFWSCARRSSVDTMHHVTAAHLSGFTWDGRPTECFAISICRKVTADDGLSSPICHVRY